MSAGRHVPGARPWDQVMRAFADLAPRSACEVVDVEEAILRVTFASVASRADQPSADVSAVDGYAVLTADLSHASLMSPVTLEVVGHADAGRPYGGSVGHGEAVRIATGASVPRGADGVVMHEDVPGHGAWVDVARSGRHLRFVGPASDRHVRRRGEDRAVGEPCVARGVLLGPEHVAALAASGVARVPVARRPTIVVVSSGDELSEAGSAPREGRTFDSAGPAIAAIARAWGAATRRAGTVGDDAGAWKSRLAHYAATGRWLDLDLDGEPFDLVVSLGGASHGPRDVVRRVLERHADVVVPAVAVRPGGPTMVARVDGRPWLALPGTPGAAAVVGAALIGAWCAAALGDGGGGPDDRAVTVRAEHDLRSLPHATALWWGRLVATTEGPVVSTLPRQGSSRLASWSESDVLVRVPAGVSVAAGDPVDVLPLPGRRDVLAPRQAFAMRSPPA